jgi:hypothetical protein
MAWVVVSLFDKDGKLKTTMITPKILVRQKTLDIWLIEKKRHKILSIIGELFMIVIQAILISD